MVHPPITVDGWSILEEIYNLVEGIKDSNVRPRKPELYDVWTYKEDLGLIICPN